MEQTAQVPSGQCGREESAGELRRSGKTVFLLKNRTTSCSIKHGMITLESLWDAKKVKEARQLEMEYYDKMHVFDKVPIAQWVAKQFKGSDSGEWFAATPPIEALRALIFTHPRVVPKKKSIDGVRRLSSLLLRSSATRDIRGTV